MALKRKIDKAAYDKLADVIKLEYLAEGDGYVLQAEGFEDPGELRRALERVRLEKQATDDALKQINADFAAMKKKIEDGTLDDAKKAKDIAALEKSWQTKIDVATQAGEATKTQYQSFITKLLRDNTAGSLAAKLGDKNAELLLPHILPRLSVDFDGTEPALRVLDAQGKPSALTVAELEQEYVANPKFAAIIVGSKGSGGGANGGRQPTGGARKKLSEMTESERTAFHKEDPDGFAKASEQAKAGSVVRL